MPTSYMERSMGQFADIAGALGKAMRERKRKELERELLGEDLETYKLRDMQEDNELERELRRAQIQRALREPALRTVPRDEDGLTAYQRKQLELSERREARLSSRPQSGLSMEDSPERLEKDLRSNFGIGWEDLDNVIKNGVPEAKRAKDDKTSDDVQFTTSAGVPMRLPRAKLLPYANRGLSIYKSRAGGDTEPNAKALTQQVKPQVAPAASIGDTPESIAAEFKARKISREEAARRLKALGFDD